MYERHAPAGGDPPAAFANLRWRRDLRTTSTTILDSVFRNGAGDSGGAVMVSASDLVVERSRFTGNHADVGGGLAGGGTTSRLDIRTADQDNGALHRRRR